MEKILGTYKAPLSIEIQKAYNALLDVLVQTHTADRTKKMLEGTRGAVSVADIVAYQIGWGSLLISWYKAGIQNKTPIMPGQGFTTWDYTGLAQHFYKKYHYGSADKQYEVFYKTVTSIIDIVEKEYQTGNLDKIGVWSWCTLPSGKQWPLSKWIQVNTVAPYKRATASLRKFIKNYYP